MKEENVIATILGLACGDALGAPTEFLSTSAIFERYGPSGIQDLSQTTGRFTDDTQMTVALAEGLLDAHESVAAGATCGVAVRENMRDMDYVMPFVVDRFVKWSRSPENNRAPGGSCMYGCRELGRGTPWRESGRPGSTGCGTAMRASPVGILYNYDDDIRDIAYAQAVCTHRSEEAKDAAYAAGLSIRFLLNGVDPQTTFANVYARIQETKNTDLSLLVYARLEAIDEGEMEPWEACWPSWTGAEAVASAWLCFLLAISRNEGYIDVARYGANTDGDSDSIACIAGSLAGAYWGIGGEKGVPESWIEHIEDSTDLVHLARRLFQVAPR